MESQDACALYNAFESGVGKLMAEGMPEPQAFDETLDKLCDPSRIQ